MNGMGEGQNDKLTKRYDEDNENKGKQFFYWILALTGSQWRSSEQ